MKWHRMGATAAIYVFYLLKHEKIYQITFRQNLDNNSCLVKYFSYFLRNAVDFHFALENLVEAFLSDYETLVLHQL